jgi:ferritin-like protein
MKPLLGGQNRTGAATAPQLAAAMIAATREFPPTSVGNGHMLAHERMEYARDAEPIGTMPAPSGLKEMAKTAVRALIGEQPTLLLDKLGERMAFERAGTRLYDALLSKHDAGRTFTGGPKRDELSHIREEECRHMLLVAEAIAELGGDPTAVTPSANLHATASMGFVIVLGDPRTDVQQGLEVLLAAELVDNDCWVTLIELTEQAGHDELAQRFRVALAEEREHLERVRGWLATATGRAMARALREGSETAREPEQRRGSHGDTGRRKRVSHARASGRSSPGAKGRSAKTKHAHATAGKRRGRH